jgi:hypothetical protein
MGNEPDLYKTSAQGAVRPSNWNEADYSKEWGDKVAHVKSVLGSACGEAWTSEVNFKWIAPSFAGTKNSLDPIKSWHAGLNKSSVVAKFSSHKCGSLRDNVYGTKRSQTIATLVAQHNLASLWRAHS